MGTFSKQKLDQQADQIEQILGRHQIQGHISGGTISPRIIRFEYVPMAGVRFDRVLALSNELASALGTPNVRINRKEEAIAIEVPRSKSKLVRLLDICQNLVDVPSVTGILGLDERRHPLLLNLTAPDVAHVLIASTLQNGKAGLTRTLLTSLALFNAPDELQIILIDPEQSGLISLASLPHVAEPVSSTLPGAITQLREVANELDRRRQAEITQPTLLLVIEELADLFRDAGKMTGKIAVEDLLAQLTQQGHSVGIHVVACTQKPIAAMLGFGAKANFPIRLVGAVTSKGEAQYATGIGNSGAENLATEDDFLLVNQGRAIRFQVGALGEDDFISVVSIMQGTVPLNVGGHQMSSIR